MFDETIESLTIADPLVPGLSYRIDIEPDNDEKPTNSQAYGEPAWVEAWKNDEWRFVGVIVTPIIDGVVDLDNYDYSLWGIGWGDFPEGAESVDMDYVVNQHPVPGMIAEVRASLAQPLAEIATVATTIAGRLAEVTETG